MTAAQIITNFELQVSDMTELSAAEELNVLNKVYFKVCSERPWEFLKKSASGTILTDATGSYIALPADFFYFSDNDQYTDNTVSYQGNAAPKVIFIGSNYSPIQIVNFSDRKKYRTSGGYAYLSLAESKIRFTVAPTLTTYDFDYISIPTALVVSPTATSPVFPAPFHYILQHGMAVENDIIQLSEKARSYAPENQALYNSYLADMAFWNANLLNN